MSTLKVNTLQTAAGVEVYTAKAWVNFNGTGTVAIRGSGNVTSITDNSTGNYTVNFTTAMPDVNYGFTVSTGSTGYGMSASNPQVTESFRIATVGSSGNSADFGQIAVTIFR